MTNHTAMDPNATHVWKYYARLVRLQRVRVLRRRNAAARRRGFRNAAEMEG